MSKKMELKNIGQYFGPEAVVSAEQQSTLCLDCAGRIRDDDDEVNLDYVEVDYPWHCDDCGALLGGVLTGDGVEYVESRLFDNLDAGQDRTVELQWLSHYSDSLHLDDCPYCDERAVVTIETAAGNGVVMITERCAACGKVNDCDEPYDDDDSQNYTLLEVTPENEDED